MNGLSVVIPSRTISNLSLCVSHIWRHNPEVSVQVIDDGLGPHYKFHGYVTEIEGQKPFCFSTNCNIGIRSCGNDSVILLNDDALLTTPNGFTAMLEAADNHPEYGVISATTNVAGNPDQRPQGIGLRDAGDKSVAFVCVLIPRRTIDTVGLLDPRFVAYGWEDNDYCRRVRETRLKVGIFDGCYVDHASLQSTFRGDPRAAGDISAGAEIYRQKWGDLA